MVLVLGCTSVLLSTGQPLDDALLGAGGLALIGSAVARRVVADAGLPKGSLPMVIVASAVAIFGAVLIVLGSDLAKAAMGAGMAGLIAGEIAGWAFGKGCAAGREV